MNIPLVEEHKKMPDYVKFMKDIIKKKSNLSSKPNDNLHHYSVIASQYLMQEKYPEVFTILCTLGAFNFSKVLCDLGTRINLMLLEISR